MERTKAKLFVIGVILIFAFIQVNVLGAQTAACPTLPAHTGSSSGTVNISEQGTYKIWTRMMVPNTNHNSYWLQIDDACGINVGDSDTITPNTWTWVAYEDGDTTQPITRDLAQGVHTVKIVGREPNVKIDNLVFAKDLSCVPVDTGANCASGGTTTPPETTPTVVSTVPTANATRVAATTDVAATFSEEMMAPSINGNTFNLTKKGSSTKITAKVSYNASTDTATLNPTNSLKAGVTYKAVVTTGAKDSVGNPLDQQYRWFFTVR